MTFMKGNFINQGKREKQTLGMKILNIIGIIILVLFFGNNLLKSVSNIMPKTYHGNGFSLEYNYNWRIGTLKTGEEALINDSDKCYFRPVGKTNLSQHENFNFDTDTEKKQIYDEFYSMYKSNMANQSMDLYNGSDGFNILKENIYYATVDYGKSSDNLSGRCYILISKDDDIVLSFIMNTQKRHSENCDATLEILEKIEITNTSDNNNNSSENTESFTSGTAEDYTVLGYMYYKMPECWIYDEQKSASAQYKSYIFNFKDGKSFVAVNANTPMDYITFETGMSIEGMREQINNSGLTIKSETIKSVNGVRWYHIVTEDYINANLGGSLHNEFYIALSKSDLHLYMLEFYISNSYDSSESKYINDSINYIINNAELLKYEE